MKSYVVMVIIFLGIASGILAQNPELEARQCAENLCKIDGAKEQWALEYKKRNGSHAPPLSELCGPNNYIREIPVCPSGGTYTLNPIGVDPVCSKHGSLTALLKKVNQLEKRKSQPVFRPFRGKPLPQKRSLGTLRACLENLVKIDGVKEQWALEQRKPNGTNPPPLVVLVRKYHYLKSVPVCPEGGKYILNPVGKDPECTVHGPMSEIQRKLEKARPSRRHRPWWLQFFTQKSDRRKCMENLTKIDGAKEQWALEYRKPNGAAPPPLKDLCGPNGYIREVPVCPSGGTYILGKIGELPRCSIHGELKH